MLLFKIFRFRLASGYYTDKKRKIRNDIRPYAEKLYSFSDKELCEIHTNLNDSAHDSWDFRLGEKPDWYKKGKDFKEDMYVNRRVCAILNEIEYIVGRKDVLRHHNIVNLGRSEEEFEKSWREWVLEGSE